MIEAGRESGGAGSVLPHLSSDGNSLRVSSGLCILRFIARTTAFHAAQSKKLKNNWLGDKDSNLDCRLQRAVSYQLDDLLKI